MIFLLGPTLIVCLFIILSIYIKSIAYGSSGYNKRTGTPFLKVYFNKGLYGEYLTSNILDKIPGYGKVLYNVYLPKKNGETSEIDLLFLNQTGIYVFESKNYSGWIFGKEKDQKWCQTLQNSRKEFFYNPIKQNKTHINVLLENIPSIPKDYVQSVIVFSERCTLKKIEVESPNTYVLKRNQLNVLFKKLMGPKPVAYFTKETIDEWYSILEKYTNVSEEVRIGHINNLKKRRA